MSRKYLQTRKNTTFDIATPRGETPRAHFPHTCVDKLNCPFSPANPCHGREKVDCGIPWPKIRGWKVDVHVKKCSRGGFQSQSFFRLGALSTSYAAQAGRYSKSMGGRREREEILLGSTVDFLYIPQVVLALSLHAPCSVKCIVNLCCVRNCADSAVF